MWLEKGKSNEEEDCDETQETEEVKEEKGEEPEEKLSFLWHESLPDRSLWGHTRNFCWC